MMRGSAHDYIMKGNLTRLSAAIKRELRDTEIRKDRNKKARDLAERVKEVTCLYVLTRIVDKTHISLEEIFQDAVDLVPPAWQYPEVICARIIFERQPSLSTSRRATDCSLGLLLSCSLLFGNFHISV